MQMEDEGCFGLFESGKRSRAKVEISCKWNGNGENEASYPF